MAEHEVMRKTSKPPSTQAALMSMPRFFPCYSHSPGRWLDPPSAMTCTMRL